MRLTIHRIIILCVLVFGLVLPLAGCKSTPTEKEMEDGLKSFAGFYNENIKWKRFERAVKYVPEGDRKSFLEAKERDREILNITETQIMDVSVSDEDPNKGTVLIWYTYYKWPDNRLKKDLLEQSWNYDAEKKWWYIDYQATKLSSSK